MGQCVSSIAGIPPENESAARRRGKKYQKKKPQHDSFIYDSIQRKQNKGQAHLLYNKKNQNTFAKASFKKEVLSTTTTSLVERISHEDGSLHIYAVRGYHDEHQVLVDEAPEQRPAPPSTVASSVVVATPDNNNKTEVVVVADPDDDDKTDVMVVKPGDNTNNNNNNNNNKTDMITTTATAVDIYTPQAMAAIMPSTPIADLICVSPHHHVYVCDTGLSMDECDDIVFETEQACRGHYAAYTYAKQTLGCREFPQLASVCLNAVSRVCHTIQTKLLNSQHLVLDDREPHIVKYDVSKKERQKLDMHTDKSEWTFLIALSDGCGLDYDGGGTFFEALDATVHIQRGHALVFPGKLRHCGKKISKGLRFLLVGFLVDKTTRQQQQQQQVVDKAQQQQQQPQDAK